nr:SH3 domain-containing kinase-binding protein 1 isoform X4 [Marmota flaviventris]
MFLKREAPSLPVLIWPWGGSGPLLHPVYPEGGFVAEGDWGAVIKIAIFESMCRRGGYPVHSQIVPRPMWLDSSLAPSGSLWLCHRGDGPKIELTGSTLASILDKDLSDRNNDIDLEGFDSVVSSTEKLSHPTTSRPKATGRRPPSQSLTSSSLSSPDIFDSPSPEEDKEEHISLAHRGVDVSKKTSKTVTISQVSDNKASLPPKPGTMAAGGGGPASLSSVASSPLSSSLGTAGHRANSPSLFSTEGKPKMEPVASSQAAVEELRTQVRELRSIIETMKDQQKREIKQLLSELDEEKKIRLRLQMEVNDIKKALQSK